MYKEQPIGSFLDKFESKKSGGLYNESEFKICLPNMRNCGNA